MTNIIRIIVVPGSNVDPEASIPDYGLSEFSVFQANVIH
jgi:hypothetical protein